MQDLRFCSTVAEYLSLLQCDTASMGECCPTFWRTVMPSSFRVKQSKKIFFFFVLNREDEDTYNGVKGHRQAVT